jgi:hypothetical protein
MRQYGVGAQIYHQPPASTVAQLEAMGLHKGNAMKTCHDFFDTLHILIALAFAEGMQMAELSAKEDGVFHVGGTSIGSLLTKDLSDLYIHIRFLEFCDAVALRPLYSSLTKHFKSIGNLCQQIKYTPQQYRQHQIVDQIFRCFDTRTETHTRQDLPSQGCAHTGRTMSTGVNITR